MRKAILIACVVALLVGFVAASASATAGNWAVQIKAFNTSWGMADKSSDLGVAATATQTTISTLPQSGKGEAVIAKGDGTFLSKQRVTANATVGTSLTWDLEVGTGGVLPAINVAIFNQAADILNANTALDIDNYYYEFKQGDTVLATWSSLLNRVCLIDAVGWIDIADMDRGLLRAKGFTPTAGLTGYYVTITPPVASASWAGLEDFSFSQYRLAVPGTPEPGSFLALGSGLVGLAGFAIRRRKA